MTQVIINDVLPLTQLISAAGQTVFTTNWTANADSTIRVYARATGVAADDATQLVNPNQYTVGYTGAQEIVFITFITPRSLSDIITISRVTPVDRQNLYTNTNFTPSMLNQDFGLFTLEIQENDMYNQLLTPRYNKSAIIEPIVDTILPILGPNQAWVKNNADTAIIALDIPSGGFAPADATYITLTDYTTALPNSLNLDSFAQGFLVNLPGTNTLAVRTFLGTPGQIGVSTGSGSDNPQIGIVVNPIMPGTAGMGIPNGTTAQRVIPMSNINLRYNTDLFAMEFWDGTEWQQLAEGGSVTTLTAGAGITLTPNPIIEAGSIALAAIADHRMMANTSGGIAAPIATTMSGWMDDSITNVIGSVFYRSTTGWIGLAPGVAGQFLQSLGPAANLQWADTGDVAGPASSTDGAIALWNGITGKIIKNSAIVPTVLPPPTYTYPLLLTRYSASDNGGTYQMPTDNSVFSVDVNRDLATADAFCYLNSNNGSAVTLTIRAQADVPFPLGGWTDVMITSDGGAITIAPAVGVIIRSPGNLLTTNGLYTGFRLRRIISNTWDVIPFGFQAQIPTNAKSGCAAATTTNLVATYSNGPNNDGVGATLTNSGAQAVFSADGALLAVGRRVLVWQQTNEFENGIYDVYDTGSVSTDWILIRSTDFNSSFNISINSYTYITGGTNNIGKTFGLATAGPYVVGTTNLFFSEPNGGVSFIQQNGFIQLQWEDFTTSSIQNSAIMGTFIETTTSSTLRRNTNNFANNGSLVIFTMPATSIAGDIIRVGYMGVGGWKIEQPAGVSIQLGNQKTTVGVAGSLQSTDVGDCIQLMCQIANTEWIATSVIGNITVV